MAAKKIKDEEGRLLILIRPHFEAEETPRKADALRGVKCLYKVYCKTL